MPGDLLWQSTPARVRDALERAITCDRVPHAYLFSGPPGARMYDTAIALATALTCPRGGCGDVVTCDPCAKIAAAVHPDVVTLVREGAAQIVPIENIRNQVIARMGLPPHEGRLRIFIVEEATSLAPPAANALLKTLEEPPARTLFVLCTTAPEQLLPTIRSRCQRVRFPAALPGKAGRESDGEAVARIGALAAELARDGVDTSSLAQRIGETKGDAAHVIAQAAAQLHTTAIEAARDGNVAVARSAAARAETILSWHTAVAIHNANPSLAIDAVLGQLARMPR